MLVLCLFADNVTLFEMLTCKNMVCCEQVIGAIDFPQLHFAIITADFDFVLILVISTMISY